MRNKLNSTFMLKMILGSAGIMLIFLAIIELASIVVSPRGRILTYLALAGYLLTFQYIHYLEEKSGISGKLCRTRSICMIFILGIIIFLLHFAHLI